MSFAIARAAPTVVAKSNATTSNPSRRGRKIREAVQGLPDSARKLHKERLARSKKQREDLRKDIQEGIKELREVFDADLKEFTDGLTELFGGGDKDSDDDFFKDITVDYIDEDKPKDP